MKKNDNDAMTAQDISDEIEKLIESERSEDENDPRDIQPLEDALASLRKFIALEIAETEPGESPKPSGVSELVKPVDTGLLSGPMPALKNFLVKSARDNESQ